MVEKGGEKKMRYTRLRYVRREKHISALDMAKGIGLRSGTAYLKKETGKVRISLQEAKIISEMLDMSIEALFYEDLVSD